MRLIDADKIYVVPAEDDNITGMGMTPDEQGAYNDGIYAVMEKIRNAKTVDAVSIDRVLEIIDAEVWSYVDYIIKHGNRNAYKQNAACMLSENIRNAVLALKGGDVE